MIYKQFQDKKISWLGEGVMRMPTIKREGERGGPIDEEKAMSLIKLAYESGVNYYDTGYFYHNGESERFIGKALGRFPRETWFLATKFPGNMVKKTEAGWEVSGMGLQPLNITHPADVFNLQLEKCGVDYFDFYMLHNIAENTYAAYTNPELGIIPYLIEQKKIGRIRHLGFSSHGQASFIDKILTDYDCFEFVMIQLNYLDWVVQDAGRKYDIITNHGLPVFVMEPLRGGKLAKAGEYSSLLQTLRPNDSPAKWALRHLQSLPNVSVVISGMSSEAQLNENVETFSNNEPLTNDEKDALSKAVNTMAKTVPCTVCKYCCGSCPKGLDIPALLTMYNEANYEFSWNLNNAIRNLNENEMPSFCVGCGLCNPLCPQGIDIPEALSGFKNLLEERARKT